MREVSSRPPPAIGEDGIRQILADEQRLSLVCQPVIDMRRGIIVGYEALSRFKLDVPAPPDVVFACATHYGLGVELEALVVQRALALAQSVPANCFLALNVDPEHLILTPVFDVIMNHGDLGGLIFELTEQRQIINSQEVVSCVAELRKRGAFIAVDDAGAGYSGLQQIHALRPQFIKVDRALVSSVHADEAKRAMIQMLGELAERLDAWLIAEGIETDAELHALAQLGVPLAQGYYLARPAPPWTTLAPEVRRALAVLPKQALSTGRVEDLLEPCRSCDLQSEWPDGAGVCVRLEPSGRPFAMRIVDENGVRVRTSHEVLRAKRNTSLSALALRSVARSERFRWDPIVCIDDLGHFEGLIHIHKLVWMLASRDHPQTLDASLEPVHECAPAAGVASVRPQR
jgi:EAL domain-containing protein (putative c-di-GMP-specific phosphodiesterase class I)